MEVIGPERAFAAATDGVFERRFFCHFDEPVDVGARIVRRFVRDGCCVDRPHGTPVSLISSMRILASTSGGGTNICRENRPGRFIAGSTSQGMFVAARISTPLLSFPTPSSCERNSFTTVRVCSELAFDREYANASSSSKNRTHGVCERALSKIAARFLSLSPIHILRT